MRTTAIILPRLTLLTTLLALFLKRIINCEIYYVEVGNSLGSLAVIRFLEKKSIKWVKKEYVAFSEYAKGLYVSNEFADIIFNKVVKSGIVKGIGKYFSVLDKLQEKMTVLWKHNIYNSIELYAQQYAAAEYLINKKQYSAATIITCNSMASLLTDNLNDNIKIIYFPILSFLDSAIGVLRKCLSADRLKNIIFAKLKSKKTSMPNRSLTRRM